MDSPDKRDAEEELPESEDLASAVTDPVAVETNGNRRTSWLIGSDIEQARKRMRWGGIAGIAAAVINFVVAVVTYFGDASVEGVIQPGGWAFLFVLAEAGLMTVLAVGLLRKNRHAAILLLGYHVFSKVALFGLAAVGVGPGSLRAIPFHLVFAYMFFQGWRGVLTWRYLTRPEYPVCACIRSPRRNGKGARGRFLPLAPHCSSWG